MKESMYIQGLRHCHHCSSQSRSECPAKDLPLARVPRAVGADAAGDGIAAADAVASVGGVVIGVGVSGMLAWLEEGVGRPASVTLGVAA